MLIKLVIAFFLIALGVNGWAKKPAAEEKTLVDLLMDYEFCMHDSIFFPVERSDINSGKAPLEVFLAQWDKKEETCKQMFYTKPYSALIESSYGKNKKAQSAYVDGIMQGTFFTAYMLYFKAWKNAGGNVP